MTEVARVESVSCPGPCELHRVLYTELEQRRQEVRDLHADAVREHVAEEDIRQGIRNAERARQLEDAIGEYLLWEPGRKGHAAAHRALVAVWRGEES